MIGWGYKLEAVQKWGPNFRSRVSAVGSQVQVFGFGYRFRI